MNFNVLYLYLFEFQSKCLEAVPTSYINALMMRTL